LAKLFTYLKLTTMKLLTSFPSSIFLLTRLASSTKNPAKAVYTSGVNNPKSAETVDWSPVNSLDGANAVNLFDVNKRESAKAVDLFEVTNPERTISRLSQLQNTAICGPLTSARRPRPDQGSLENFATGNRRLQEHS
jgi:hypothetical protein